MSSEREIGILNPECLQAAWPDVVELLEAHGQDLLQTYDLKELFVNVLSGTYDLWVVSAGEELKLVGFCTWERHSHCSNYHVLWVGGQGLALLKMAVPLVEQYACMNGASELLFGGRRGWGRVLRPLGFVPKARWGKTISTCWTH